MKIKGRVQIDRRAPLEKPRPPTPDRPAIRKSAKIALAIVALALVVRGVVRRIGDTSC